MFEYEKTVSLKYPQLSNMQIYFWNFSDTVFYQIKNSECKQTHIKVKLNGPLSNLRITTLGIPGGHQVISKQVSKQDCTHNKRYLRLLKDRRSCLQYDFWLKTLRDSKVRATEHHGEKFRNRLASSFSGIIHCYKMLDSKIGGLSHKRPFLASNSHQT